MVYQLPVQHDQTDIAHILHMAVNGAPGETRLSHPFHTPYKSPRARDVALFAVAQNAHQALQFTPPPDKATL